MAWSANKDKWLILTKILHGMFLSGIVCIAWLSEPGNRWVLVMLSTGIKYIGLDLFNRVVERCISSLCMSIFTKQRDTLRFDGFATVRQKWWREGCFLVIKGELARHRDLWTIQTVINNTNCCLAILFK